MTQYVTIKIIMIQRDLVLSIKASNNIFINVERLFNVDKKKKMLIEAFIDKTRSR